MPARNGGVVTARQRAADSQDAVRDTNIEVFLVDASGPSLDH